MWNSPTLPAKAIAVCRSSLQGLPSNAGLIVLVDTSHFVQSMVEVFSRGEGCNRLDEFCRVIRYLDKRVA